MQELYQFVKKIPRGKVMSYGQVGKSLQSPMPALHVGWAMATAPEGVPWWRVVGKDGTLLIHKRDPALAKLQRHHLEAEGVQFDEQGRVRMSGYQETQEDQSALEF
jgi:methylated-DNA-protein-cysteine methyltransferase-like protein